MALEDEYLDGLEILFSRINHGKGPEYYFKRNRKSKKGKKKKRKVSKCIKKEYPLISEEIFGGIWRNYDPSLKYIFTTPRRFRPSIRGDVSQNNSIQYKIINLMVHTIKQKLNFPQYTNPNYN